MIILITAIGFFVLKYLVTALLGFAIWVQKEASGLEAVVLVAIISAAVSITGVLINSIFAKLLEAKQKRREYLAQKREESYSDFVAMMFRIISCTDGKQEYAQSEILKDTLKFSKDILLWGSPRVVRKWITFRKTCTTENQDPLAVLHSMEEIVNEMRKDLGMKRMKKDELLAVFIKDMQ